MSHLPNFDKILQNKLPRPVEYGGCDFLDEYADCQVLLDGHCPACGAEIAGHHSTASEVAEYWSNFKRFYPIEYEAAKQGANK